MMRRVIIGGIIGAAALSGGCASIVTGQNQSLTVETSQGGEPLTSAHCKLNNDKGTWYVTTPGSVTVHRSYNDLSVRCEKDGAEPGLLSVKSSTKGMAFGNILFGGVIGAGVDVSTGAAYDYPPLVTVEMGKNRTLVPEIPKAEDVSLKTGPGSSEDP